MFIMALKIEKAVKYGAKLRMALYGIEGTGKTFTALSLAREMAGDGAIMVIDSERGSATKYADIFEFDTIKLTDFHPQTYVDAIKMTVQAKKYKVLIIDSISQEWDGTRGALELAGHKFQNWDKVTPLHNGFIDAILDADMHIICTMRAKEEHVMETGDDNKPKVRYIGIEPIQRKNVKYEFDIIGSLDTDNTLTVMKTRCSELYGRIFPRAGKEMASIMLRWLDGIPAPLTVKDAYEACFSAGLVKSKSDLFPYASTVLGFAVTAENVLSLEQEYLKAIVTTATTQKAS